jgi:hypothetical protein
LYGAYPPGATVFRLAGVIASAVLSMILSIATATLRRLSFGWLAPLRQPWLRMTLPIAAAHFGD